MKYTKREVQADLLTVADAPTDKNGVFLYVQLNSRGIASHAGLLIVYNGSVQIFHFANSVVRLLSVTAEDKDDNVVVKKLENITEGEVEGFLALSRVVSKKAQPRMGFIYDGGSYDAIGNHFSANGMGEYMTCVGFCLSMLKSYLQKDYIEYTDWDETSAPKDFFETFIEEEGVDPEKFRKHLRRITPCELMTASFYSKLPIRRSDIEEIINLVAECMRERILKAA